MFTYLIVEVFYNDVLKGSYVQIYSICQPGFWSLSCYELCLRRSVARSLDRLAARSLDRSVERSLDHSLARSIDRLID